MWDRLRKTITIVIIGIGITSLVGILTATEALQAKLSESLQQITTERITLSALEGGRHRGITLFEAEALKSSMLKYLPEEAISIYAAAPLPFTASSEGGRSSPNLQILLDPVNLLNMENVDRREEVFAEAIELLGKDVAMIHFKDFLRQDAGGQLAATGAGQGGMGDYRTILRFAKEQKPYVFATLENTTPENAVQCLQYLQKQYDEC